MTPFLCNFNSMALHSLYCADVPETAHSLNDTMQFQVSENRWFDAKI